MRQLVREAVYSLVGYHTPPVVFLAFCQLSSFLPFCFLWTEPLPWEGFSLTEVYLVLEVVVVALELDDLGWGQWAHLRLWRRRFVPHQVFCLRHNQFITGSVSPLPAHCRLPPGLQQQGGSSCCTWASRIPVQAGFVLDRYLSRQFQLV